MRANHHQQHLSTKRQVQQPNQKSLAKPIVKEDPIITLEN